MTPLDDNSAPAAIQIAPYDPGWVSLFEGERRLLAGCLASYLVAAIEHVGSTAVPGLAAKPVIDMMAPVVDLESSRPSIAALSELAYCYAPYRADVMHWFCKPSPTQRTHHLYLVPFGSELWRDRIAFRDYLRVHSAAALEYEALKRQLALCYPADREAYTAAKTPFIRRIVEAARGAEPGAE